jgi:ATP-dependent Clp protease ATP-binding subunit ClpC
MAGTGSLDRFTTSTRELIQLAKKSTVQFKHSHITPEHILLGMLQLNDPGVIKALKSVKMDAQKIKVLVDHHLRPGQYDISEDDLTFSERAKRVIEAAKEECIRAQQKQIGPEHLLLGLLRIPNTVAHAVLAAVDLKDDAIRATLAGKS